MVGVFVALTGAGVVAFAIMTAWYLGSYQTHGGSVSGMMGQMMGGSGGSGMSLAMPWNIWFSVVMLAGVVLVGVVGLGYYLAFPEIKRTSSEAVAPTSLQAPHGPVPAPVSSEAGWSTLMKTSKPEEKKVLEVLAAHEGHYLQKFVVKESGLSKLKTHRIVSRFAERGVVTVVKSGNTNEVSLASWAMKDKPTTT